ncbi:RIP metalloprotease RseP [Nonlabens xiamenensis]|uniref:RIP metalloprotease RseP n=1 Tax=Nonlabens xiamenensis TaxID=2341043 RepID=UPI000F605B84|nr:RIP metalloprotease RseP [Nonlabens xiamenensis]
MHPTLVLIINFLLSLSLLIVLHELGHFIPARLFKTRVEKFYLFFDIKYSLFKKKIGETVYGIGWLPLGGYVKISGMIDESMDKEQMAQEPKPWEFRSKPAWQRLIIMLGGVIVNVIVGFVIYIGLMYFSGVNEAAGTDYKYGFGYSKTLEEIGFEQGDQILMADNDSIGYAPMLNHMLLFRDVEKVTVLRKGQPVEIAIPEDFGRTMFDNDVKGISTPRFPFVIDSVEPGSYAEKIGLEKGMTITSLAGRQIDFNTDVSYALRNNVQDSVPFEFTVEKDGQSTTKTATYNADEVKTIGAYWTSTDPAHANVSRSNYSLGEAVKEGLAKGYYTMNDYIAQFKYIFTGKGASKLGGFGTIAKMYPDSFDWAAFWGTTAFISFVLAIMNILPIPALDGGHVMFLLYEIITGRKPGDKFLERAQIIGIVLLLALLLYANGNDLFRAVFG